MILPTKHIPAEAALIGIGGKVLASLAKPQSVSAVWDTTRRAKVVSTFSRFALALDLLFIIGAIRIENGLLERVK